MDLDGRGFFKSDSNVLSVSTTDRSFSTVCILLLTGGRCEEDEDDDEDDDDDDDDDGEEEEKEGEEEEEGEDTIVSRGCSTACVSASNARLRVDRFFIEAIGAFRIRTRASTMPVSQYTSGRS